MFLSNKGFKNGWISLNEPKNVYYAGQLLIGSVNFDLAENTKILALNVAHLGEVDVHWTEEQVETHSSTKQRNKIHYIGRQEMFNCLHCLTGNNGSSILLSGTHTIPFIFQIPFTAPSSFSHDKGEIKYSVTAFLVHENEFKEKLSTEYKVVAALDLNANEENKRPIIMDFEDVQCSKWFCKTRPISLRVEVPHSGYCPGEIIPITVYARNSSTEVNKIIFMLTIKERYHSERPMSTFIAPEEVLVQKKLEPIQSRCNRTYTTSMKVPDMIAPNLENCTLIDIAYFFKVKIQRSGCFNFLEEESEINIGLVPLNKRFDINAHPLFESLPNAPIPDVNTPTTMVEDKYDATITPDNNISANHSLAVVACPSYPFVSIADVVDKNRPQRSIDLYTSYEMGYRSENVPSSMFPLPKPEVVPIPIPNLPKNETNSSNNRYCVTYQPLHIRSVQYGTISIE